MELNARPCNKVVDGALMSIPWSAVDVGDILYLTQDEFIPADLVMLHASNPGGMAYVETSNLDGYALLLVCCFFLCLFVVCPWVFFLF